MENQEAIAELKREYEDALLSLEKPEFKFKHKILENFMVEMGLGEVSFGFTVPLIRYYREAFYRFNGQYYEEYSYKTVKSKLYEYLTSKFPEKLGNNILIEFFSLLKIYLHINEKLDSPIHIGPLNPKEMGPSIIGFKNGLLDINNKKIIKPSWSDFIINSFPFNYEPDANSDKWLKFLGEVFPDKVMHDLLQEIFGYVIAHNTLYDKFFLFYGNGANGKSVVCRVLKMMLGETNYSSVPFEQFRRDNRFSLYYTLGKLANISEDMDSNKMSAEGLIKDFVSGGEMPFEQKCRDPIQAKATARLIFCTNTLPTSKDRSEGLWRRIIILPFEQTFHESHQNEFLRTKKYWHNELSGVFNWAMEGKARLEARGYFLVPERSKNIKEEYRKASNSILQYFDEGIVVTKNEDNFLTLMQLYRDYKGWCRDSGCHEFNKNNFSKELKYRFSENYTRRRVNNDSESDFVNTSVNTLSQQCEHVQRGYKFLKLKIIV